MYISASALLCLIAVFLKSGSLLEKALFKCLSFTFGDSCKAPCSNRVCIFESKSLSICFSEKFGFFVEARASEEILPSSYESGS